MTYLLLFFALIIVLIIYTSKKQKERKSKFRDEGYDLKNVLNLERLVGGHPDINIAVPRVKIIANENKIAICDMNLVPKGYISKESIKNVKFEDATTFEKRISAGRLLLVGVFALAWKKRSKNENAYLVVEWADGRFDNSTSFLFQGSGSTQRANAARNWMIKELR